MAQRISAYCSCLSGLGSQHSNAGSCMPGTPVPGLMLASNVQGLLHVCNTIHTHEANKYVLKSHAVLYSP